MEEKDKKEQETTGSQEGTGLEQEQGQPKAQPEPSVEERPEQSLEELPQALTEKASAISPETAAEEVEPAKPSEPVLEASSLRDNPQDGETVPVMVAEDGQAIPEAAEGGKSSKLWPIVSLVLAVLLIVVLIKPPFATSKAEAVATVNGVEITKDRLYEAMIAGGGHQALDTLINQELIDQEAAKQNITVSETDIESELKMYLTQFGSEEKLNEALTQFGMTRDQLDEQIVQQLKLTKLLEPQIEVTDDQVKQIFEQNKESFNTPEQVRASIILVATEEEAKEIVKELDGGADFAELAKNKSLDVMTKGQGGDTDFFARGEQDPSVEEASFKLAKGEVSEPVKTSEGYQVIKVTDRKEAHTATLEEKQEEIRKALVAQQVSGLSGTWLQDIRNGAEITNVFTDTDESEAESGQ
ncbi:foldase protein PrsA [Paenibacillus sanguinis]|uniref:foldase protein PrsA n=1 Tax=Paenibacillus sanguinis TaxID=225906 RepID=UPI0003AA18DD|nr:peptidyl-prolyl cis-trans isomerase [Paenibacillus sanguinis]